MIETGTVIVGASAAGLATAACLKRAGAPFVLLEQSDQVGAAWRKHYDRLHLHTSKGLSSLPFAPFPAAAPRYPPRAQVVEYLEEYARRFELQPRFGQRVVKISRAGDRWHTRTDDADYDSRSVVVATGYTREPNRPAWPGMETFRGAVLHSSEYRNGETWSGKPALVVGIGNSGGEIALDLCERGARPDISVRSPINVVPRDFLGIPILAWGIALSVLPLWLADAIAGVVSRITLGNLEALGLRRLPMGPMSQISAKARIPLLDIGTIARIRCREIGVQPPIAEFTAGGVRFEDGTEKPYEVVVLATGYRPALGEILEEAGALDAGGSPRSSGAEVLPGLWFCGFHVASTGMLREIGREARRIAAAIARAQGV